MSILESVQHGLEKVSQEASYLAKIQHLHAVVNDLTFRCGLDHQALANKAMELYAAGHLTQNELLPLCQELANFQQQIEQVKAELKQLQENPPASHVEQPTGPGSLPSNYPGAPVPSTGYFAYPGTPLPPSYASYAATPGAPVPPGYAAAYPGAPGASVYAAYPGTPGAPVPPPASFIAYAGDPTQDPTKRVPTDPLPELDSSGPAETEAATPETAAPGTVTSEPAAHQ
jgi:hypothetical protein